MREIEIYVNFNKNEIYHMPINLVKNDYNSTKLKFEFDVDNSLRKTIQIARSDNNYLVDEIENNEYVIDRRITQKAGVYQFDACLYGEDDKITSYVTSKMIVRDELIDTEQENEEIVEDDRYPILDKLIEDVNNGLTTINNKLSEIDTAIENVDNAIERTEQAIEETNNLDLDVNKVNKTATVELTKKDGTTKSVNINDGVSLQFMWQGTSLGIKTDDMQDYVFVNLQGIQGIPGPQGEPFRIKKTYSSVAEMNADFDNMNVGDYVMIASSVEQEDNAKLFTRGESRWIFITDFSGAMGIKGETGLTPNIQIGTVTSGTTPSVTRTGTNENPILNFVLVKGDTGETGRTGATGNGIASIEKTSETASEKNFRINYTNGDHFDYSLENGEVTQAQLDELQEELDRYKMLENALPKVEGEGESITMDNTAESPMKMELGSNGKQKTTSGKNKLNTSTITQETKNGITCYYDSDTQVITFNGTCDTDNTTISLSEGELSFTANTTTSSAHYVSGSVSGYCYIRNFSADYSSQNVFDISTLNNNNPIASKTTNATFTSPRTTIRFDNGSVCNNFKIKLMVADSTDTTYEPYTNGASPNPQFPSQVQVVSGDNEVIVGNKNLVNFNHLYQGQATINGITYTPVFDEKGLLKYINANGTATADSTYVLLNGTPDLENGQYILSGCPSGGSFSTYRINWAYTGANDTGSGATADFTGTNGQIKIIVSNGTTVNNLQFKPMVRLTTISDNTYEQHQEQNFTISLGDIEYVKINDNYKDEFYKAEGTKNLFDKDGTLIDGWITENGVQNQSSNFKTSDYIPIQPNTTYITSGMASGTGGDPSRCYYDKNKNFISGTKHYNVNPFVDTSPSNAYYMKESVKIVDLNTTQVEKSSTATDFEPFGNGKWYIKHNVKKYVLNGTENYFTSGQGFACSSVSDYSRTGNIIYCETYKGLSNVGGISGLSNNQIAFNNDINFDRLYIVDERFSNINDLKSEYATNNVTLYYGTNTPEYELLNDTLQTQLNNIEKYVKSYQGQTNITQTNDGLPFIINASALKDLSSL